MSDTSPAIRDRLARPFLLVAFIALISFAVVIPVLAQPSNWIPIEQPGGGLGLFVDPGNLPSASSTVTGVATKPANIVTVCSAGCDYTSIKSAVDYVATQSPGKNNRWLVDVATGQYTELAFTVPTYTNLSGSATPNTRTTNSGSSITADQSVTYGPFITIGGVQAQIQDFSIRVTAPHTGNVQILSVDALNTTISNVAVSIITSQSGFTTAGIKANESAYMRESSVTMGSAIDSVGSAGVVVASGKTLSLWDTIIESQGDAPAVRFEGTGTLADYGGNRVSGGLVDDGIDLSAGATYSSFQQATSFQYGEVLGTSDGGAAIPDQDGTIPTCDASYGRGLTEDQDGDLCYCDTSGWALVASLGGGACE